MDAKLRIHIHQQVNMIRHDFELDQLGVASRAHPRDDLFQSLVRAVHQHRSAVFWTPHDVELAREHDVAVAAV